MAKPLVYNATLVERVDHTDALASFKIEPDQPLPGDPIFVPGQYVTIGLNNEAEPALGSVQRPMSIASAPEEGQTLELYIRYVNHPESDNPLTHLLWPTRVGDRLFMRPKAVGRFTLHHTVGDDDRRHKLLVAAGTGLAPFTSMVRSHHLRRGDDRLDGYTILHGASYPADLAYRQELEALRDRRGLHYHPTVSRPREAPDWRGASGRVEDFFLPERLEALDRDLGFRLDPAHAVVYICGLQGTIGRTIERLLRRGFVPENRKLRRALEVDDAVGNSLFFEQYDNTPVIDLNDPQRMAELRARLRGTLAAT